MIQKHRLEAGCVSGNMNQIHVKLADLRTHMLPSCVPFWRVPAGRQHQPLFDNIIQPITITLLWHEHVCALSLTHKQAHMDSLRRAIHSH